MHRALTRLCIRSAGWLAGYIHLLRFHVVGRGLSNVSSGLAVRCMALCCFTHTLGRSKRDAIYRDEKSLRQGVRGHHQVRDIWGSESGALSPACYPWESRLPPYLYNSRSMGVSTLPSFSTSCLMTENRLVLANVQLQYVSSYDISLLLGIVSRGGIKLLWRVNSSRWLSYMYDGRMTVNEYSCFKRRGGGLKL